MRGGLVILLSVFGQVWPFEFGFCLGLDGRICIYRDWPLVALNPLTALRGYLYDECFRFRFRVFLSRFEVNMSCRLIFNSDETFNSVGSFVIFVKIIYL